MAGTGRVSASSGSQILAARRQPSDIGIQQFSMHRVRCGNSVDDLHGSEGRCSSGVQPWTTAITSTLRGLDQDLGHGEAVHDRPRGAGVRPLEVSANRTVDRLVVDTVQSAGMDLAYIAE